MRYEEQIELPVTHGWAAGVNTGEGHSDPVHLHQSPSWPSSSANVVQTGGAPMPYQEVTSWPPQSGNISLWPSTCSGQIHVWACEHTVTCKCGRANRSIATCQACGK